MGQGRALLGWAIACALLGAAISYVDDAERTGELVNWIRSLTVVIVIWLVAFPVWETIFPRRPKR
ncbi:hypothetical protein KBX37_12735 [Micromonospora sp. U56]|uniref:hypothetical protein n=1 Tax=Micromonospora sp. U56 TaxID=2824900 RepID=UPI001B38CC10|nr:hypothetical protein [Micromonospora sp. U56]MBQ0893953.1 hypothetical protein [Micromonospora sp. U56]